MRLSQDVMDRPLPTNPGAMLNAALAGTLPAPSPLAARWRLDRNLVFLNFGSYGGCPDDVLAAHDDYRARVERDPVRFFKVDLERLLDGVREKVAPFVGCRPQDLAPIRNATIALATIFFATPFREGDEVVTNNHEYSSGTNELARLAARTGLRVVTAEIPFPITDPAQAADAIIGAITPRTRLVVMSHVTSCTSLVMPVERVIAECHARGIDILIDGAHAPGQIDLNIEKLNPTYYVGSFHKWLCAPKGTGFLWVRPDRQAAVRSAMLSSRAAKVRDDRPLFLRDFDYMGTDDYTGMLCVPHAIEAMAKMIPGGWEEIRRRNRSLVLEAREAVCAMAGLRPACPDSMVGSMVSLPLPEADASLSGRTTLYDDPLQDALLERHRVQVPIWRLGEGTPANPGVRIIRLSAQLYNSIEQYRYLGEALVNELNAERALKQTG
jgi:isopenicillin-N epimerase